MAYHKQNAWNGHLKQAQKLERERKWKNNREMVIDMRRAPCSDCGLIAKDPRIMHFDHLRDKKFNISYGCKYVDQKTLLKEICKCEIVCPNCHALRTLKRLDLLKEVKIGCQNSDSLEETL